MLDRVEFLDPTSRVHVRNVRLPLSDDPSSTNVEIDQGRVVGIGGGPTPADANVIEGHGAYLIPGLIDAHVHFTGDTSKDPFRRYIQPRDTARAIRAAHDAAAILGAGFTTVRVLGHAHPDIVYGLRDSIEAGWTPGPRILTSGWALSQTGGHGNLRAWPYDLVEQRKPRSTFVDGEVEIRKVIRRNFGEGADLVKVFVSEGRIESPRKFRNKLNFTQQELEVMVDEAHRRGAKVSAHATTREAVRAAVLAGIDTIEHGARASDPELADLMAERGAFLIPTLSVAHNTLATKEERGLSAEVIDRLQREAEGAATFLREALAAGVRVVCGTDSSTRPASGRNAIEIELLSKAGCTIRQALDAATTQAAAAIGLEGEVGTVAPGALADLLLLDDDPTIHLDVLRDPGRLRVLRSPTSLE